MKIEEYTRLGEGTITLRREPSNTETPSIGSESWMFPTACPQIGPSMFVSGSDLYGVQAPSVHGLQESSHSTGVGFGVIHGSCQEFFVEELLKASLSTHSFGSRSVILPPESSTKHASILDTWRRQQMCFQYDRTLRFGVVDGGDAAPQAEVRRESGVLATTLIQMLLDEPVEAGITHPAERFLEEMIHEEPHSWKDRLSQVLVDEYSRRPSLAAAIIYCVGSLDRRLVGQWGFQVVDEALRDEDCEVRDAAIRALEEWGGSEAIALLRQHSEPDPWLAKYVQQVIIDLTRDSS